jgi:GDSL-like Lipase/Acylhydrolase family
MSVRKPLARFALRGAVVVASMLVALIVAELVVRVWLDRGQGGDVGARLERSRAEGLAATEERFSLIGLVESSPWPEVVYQLKPNLAGSFRGQSVRTNSLGQRGAAEITREKPPGTFRIAGIGDSVMFGWGVGEGEPYLQILAAKLAERAPAGRRFEVMSFAVPGYNTSLEVAAFEHRALPLEPDLVVIHFVGNDFGLPHFLRREGSEEGSRPRSRLWEVLAARFFPSPDDQVDPDLIGHDSDRAPGVRAEAKKRYQHLAGEEAYRRAMARLGELSKAHDVPVIVLALGGESGRGAIAREAAEANGFTFLNAAPRFYEDLVARNRHQERKAWVTEFRIPKDGHPNVRAHRLYADVLLAEIERRGLVGGVR